MKVTRKGQSGLILRISREDVSYRNLTTGKTRRKKKSTNRGRKNIPAWADQVAVVMKGNPAVESMIVNAYQRCA